MDCACDCGEKIRAKPKMTSQTKEFFLVGSRTRELSRALTKDQARATPSTEKVFMHYRFAIKRNSHSAENETPDRYCLGEN